MKRTWLMGVLLITCAMAGTSFAVVPSTMTYQGVLASPGGAVVPDGAYWVRFRLYTTLAAGDTNSSIWRESVRVQTVKGVFTAVLGSSALQTPVQLASVPFDVPYWLGLSVAGGAELAPRITLTASPYSLNSRATTGVAYHFVAGGSMATPPTVVTSVTITLPAAGYVQVSYSGYFDNYHLVNAGDVVARMSLSENTSLVFDGSFQIWGIPSASATGQYFEPFSRSFVYQKSAGTYTFNLVSDIWSKPVGESLILGRPMLVAVYLPSVYGTAINSAPPALPAGLEGAQDGAGPTGAR